MDTYKEHRTTKKDFKYRLIYRGMCDFSELSVLGAFESFDPHYNSMILYSPLDRGAFRKYASEVLQTCVDQLEVQELPND